MAEDASHFGLFELQASDVTRIETASCPKVTQDRLPPNEKSATKIAQVEIVRRYIEATPDESCEMESRSELATKVFDPLAPFHRTISPIARPR
ncbi:MAG: hypothetical protein HKL83_05040 [Acidimicrobiaceae bacterium]|nr:hypothetical protein [Acidimicrobiaceae bacterium]